MKCPTCQDEPSVVIDTRANSAGHTRRRRVCAAEIRIDPAVTYGRERLAEVLGVSVRQLDRWRNGRRGTFPRPFYIGREPYWRGQVIVNWMENRQREAAA